MTVSALGQDANDRADITTRADISALVRTFYRRVFAEPLLAPIFIDIAQIDLVTHLPVRCGFWATALLDSGGYRRNALHSHLVLHARVQLKRRTSNAGLLCGRPP